MQLTGEGMQTKEYPTNDTIVAISTPSGRGAIGIVRLSGCEAYRLAQRVIHGRGKKPWNPEARKLTRVHLVDPSNGRSLDEGLAVLFRKPHSFTGEDLVEFQVHGSSAVLRELVRILTDLGARLAQPGEFTYRAFIHGKLDLIQAEALNDLIQADNIATARIALNQLEGVFSQRLESWRSSLLDILAEVEAEIDFGETDDAAPANPVEREKLLSNLIDDLNQLLDTYRQGRALREGWEIVLAGKPNVGKSSLFNRMLQSPRAIVTPVPGTTRDFLKERMLLEGMAVDLVDTAGLREVKDDIEHLGILRTHKLIHEAQHILWLLDVSQPLDEEDDSIYTLLEGRPFWIVINKIDLKPSWTVKDALNRFGTNPIFAISCETGEGLDELTDALQNEVRQFKENIAGEDLVLTNIRHQQALLAVRESLKKARQNVQCQSPLPILAEDLRLALDALDSLTGPTDIEEILNRIFSQFCIGK